MKKTKTEEILDTANLLGTYNKFVTNYRDFFAPVTIDKDTIKKAKELSKSFNKFVNADNKAEANFRDRNNITRYMFNSINNIINAENACENGSDIEAKSIKLIADSVFDNISCENIRLADDGDIERSTIKLILSKKENSYNLVQELNRVCDTITQKSNTITL